MGSLGLTLVLLGASLTPQFSYDQLFSVQRQPRGVRIEITPFYQWMFGSTRVDEFSQVGSQLSLSRDLGMKNTLGMKGSLGTRLRHWLFEIQGLWYPFRGKGRLPYTVAYDEALLPAQIPFQVEGSFTQIQGQVGYSLSFQKNSFQISPFFGIEYTQFSLGLRSRAGPSSSEYYGQFLPYPILGIEMEKEWSCFSISMQAEGTFFQNWSTFQEEGGTLKMSISEFRFQCKVTFFISSFAAWYIGGRIWFFQSRLYSPREDDNRFHLWSPALLFGMVIGL
ncbi:MAG: hypothetical protein D6785_11590 [Planctomycetota bacterium]|nr:MAG: hypothetical protein D6785_11590 [Planctomycetota bacterium]